MLFYTLTLAFAGPPAVLTPQRTEVPIGRVERAVAQAREHLGEPYRWEGRGTRKYPGWDCLGILFRAYGKVDRRGWWTYEVNPSELVANGKLGQPVDGISGVLRTELDPTLLQAGDVLYFLRAEYEIPDEPLLVKDEVRYWPWHTGLYVGNGHVLHAAPGDVVREQILAEITFDALFATRRIR
jgi:cell wall-associated NlpC family hydrolase